MNELEVQNQTKVITPLKDLVQAFIEAREKIKILDEEYEKQAEPLKEAKKLIETEILQTFKDRGEFSTRIDKATASLAVRKTALIGDEKKLVETLKNSGLETYIEERVSDIFKDSVLKEQAKAETPLEGVIIKETEYLSIRSNEKKDARKLSTGDYVQIKENNV